MFKLEKSKLVISASAVSLVALFAAGCMGGPANYPKGDDIAGGVIYPIENGMTGPYLVNQTALDNTVYQGRVPTANELKAWNKDIQAGGVGLPEGEGSVEDGEAIYEAKCVMCHGDFGSGGGGYPALSKGNGAEGQKTLTNNRWKDPEAEGPSRYFGSYWPEASTMWWYIKDGMPHPKSKTLTNDEVYALTAYMLAINELEVDGEVVDDEFVLTKENFAKIKMPNKDGFEPKVHGPSGLDNVRKYFANPVNFGAIKVSESSRCMSDCQQTDKIVRIQNGGIDDFHPPMSVERSLPKNNEMMAVKTIKDPKETYQANCAMCHDSFLSPGSAEWKSYTRKGMKKVYKNAIKGTPGGMPAKGGSSLSDSDFKLVVDYVVSGKVK